MIPQNDLDELKEALDKIVGYYGVNHSLDCSCRNVKPTPAHWCTCEYYELNAQLKDLRDRVWGRVSD